MLGGPLEPISHCFPESAIERVGKHGERQISRGLPRDGGGAVSASVVYLRDQVADAAGFVEGRQDNEDTPRSSHSSHHPASRR